MVPREGRRIEIDGRPIHYVDEGEGPPLLFVHAGTGSFPWRDVIVRLRERFRCVGLDVLGAARRGSPEGEPLDLGALSRFLESFVRALDLSDLTLVLHDLGGPVALGIAPGLHDRIRALIVTESFGWPLAQGAPGLARMPGLARGRIRWLRAAGSSDDYLRGVDRTLRTVLRDLPVLLVFGQESPAVKAGFPERWRERFPGRRAPARRGQPPLPDGGRPRPRGPRDQGLVARGGVCRMSAPARHPDVWDVAIALVFIAVGVALAASLLFLFIGAPMVMIGVELLMPRSG